MEMEMISSFDYKLNKVILDEKYAFFFLKSDGFTGRLLSAQLSIDWDYKYVLEMDYFSTHKHKPYYREEGQLEANPKIYAYFESLFEGDYATLKHSYDYKDLDITDIGAQLYLLNFQSYGKTTLSTTIIEGLEEAHFESKIEKILYDFNQYLVNWVEKKYALWTSH